MVGLNSCSLWNLCRKSRFTDSTFTLNRRIVTETQLVFSSLVWIFMALFCSGLLEFMHSSKCFQNLWIHECFHFLTKRFRRRWDSEWTLLTIRTEPVPVSLEFLRCDAVWMLCRYMLLWALTERTYRAVRDIFSPTYLCVCVRWRRYSCQEGRHYDPSLPAWPC